MATFIPTWTQTNLNWASFSKSSPKSFHSPPPPTQKWVTLTQTLIKFPRHDGKAALSLARCLEVSTVMQVFYSTEKEWILIIGLTPREDTERVIIRGLIPLCAVHSIVIPLLRLRAFFAQWVKGSKILMKKRRRRRNKTNETKSAWILLCFHGKVMCDVSTITCV